MILLLIAEGEIQPVENFIQHAINYANKYSSYGIIKLQRDGKTPACERLYQASDEPDALIYGDTNQFTTMVARFISSAKMSQKINRTFK